MSDSNNIQTVKHFFTAQYAGEYDSAFKYYTTPDFNWIVSSGNNPELRKSIPWAGYTHKGKEGYINLTSLLFSEFEPLAFEQHHYTDAGNKVFVEGRFSFRHRETGKIANSDWLARFDMRDGLISGGQFYENTEAVASARSFN